MAHSSLLLLVPILQMLRLPTGVANWIKGWRGDLLAPISSNIILPQFTICSLWPLHPGIRSPHPQATIFLQGLCTSTMSPEPTPGLSHRQVFYVHLRVPEMAATTSPYLSFGMFGFVGDCCRWICNCRVDGRVGVAAWGETSNWICGDYGFKW